MTQEKSGCVLVVDDETDMLDIISLLLESCGYRVLTAHNGAEALEILHRIRPCVVLLDLMMPVMDGWQFRAAQLREPSLANVPVVVMTGAGIAAGSNELFATAGAFLEKPVEMQVLLQSIAKYCSANPLPPTSSQP